MGGYSSDEEHDRRRKKKSKRASRSRSGSNDSRKSKKSKHKKKRSRSRSNRRHRSRSDSRDRYQRSRSKRSRSRERYRSRSRSRGRHRSRERSYEERRSRSRGRNRSRSDSAEWYSSSRRRRSNSSTRGASRDHSSSRSEIESISKSFADMTPAEQNQARMQLAIEKAKAADEAIRQRHGIDDDEPADTKKRQQDIRDIENEGFSQQTFSSNRNTNTKKKDKASELAFGTSLDYVKKSNNASVDSDSIMHPRLSEDESIRKMRWHEKLKKLRTKFSGS